MSAPTIAELVAAVERGEAVTVALDCETVRKLISWWVAQERLRPELHAGEAPDLAALAAHTATESETAAWRAVGVAMRGDSTVTLSAAQVDNVRTVWRAAHPGEDDPPLSEALAAALPHRPVLGGRLMTGSFWADCPEIERGPEGRPVFKGTPVALASFFAVLAGDRTVADFLDAVPRHVTGEQVDAVLAWLVEQCGHRLEFVNDPADADPPPKERNLAGDDPDKEAER